MENNTGTITWFEIAKDGPPPVGKKEFEATNKWSEQVLISKLSDPEYWMITKAVYVHHIEAFQHSTGNWQPTHWAYINYP